MRLNSSITINLASMCAIILILINMMIRINMHIYDNCEDNLAFVGYQIEFQRQFCVPEIPIPVNVESVENVCMYILQSMYAIIYY